MILFFENNMNKTSEQWQKHKQTGECSFRDKDEKEAVEQKQANKTSKQKQANKNRRTKTSERIADNK